MRHLIAKKQRVQSMLDELRGNPWLVLGSEALREVLSDENIALMLAEQNQHAELRSQRLRKMGIGHWADQEPQVDHFADTARLAKRETAHSLEKIPKLIQEITEANRLLLHHRAQVGNWRTNLERMWDALSEREQRFFKAKVPNPSSALDFPSPHAVKFFGIEHGELGVFYPERGVDQEAQIRKLEEELGRIERDLNDTPIEPR